MYELEIVGDRITIRPSLGTAPSTAADSQSRDHTTHRMDVDDVGRNDVHNAPVNESQAGSSSRATESGISEAFGLVKLSCEDFNKLTKVLQKKQDNFEEKFMRKVRNPKKSARAKRELWRMILEVEETIQVARNRMLNGVRMLDSEDESDDDQPSHAPGSAISRVGEMNGDPPVNGDERMETDDLSSGERQEEANPNLEVPNNIAKAPTSTIPNVGYESSTTPEIDTSSPSDVRVADESVHRLTPFNQIVSSPLQIGTVSENPAASDERETETNDFTTEVPPNDEVMDTNPSSAESIRSSTTEDDSPLSDLVPSAVQSAPSTTEKDENPLTQADCTGAGSKSASSEQSDIGSVEDFDEDLDSSVCKFDDDDENTNASSLEIHEGDDYAEVESTIYRFETDASDDGGMETDAVPSNVQDDEEIMESVPNGISTSVETNLSAEKNCGSRSPVLDDTGFSEGSDINDTSGQSESPTKEYSNEEMDAKRHKVHVDEEKTEIDTLDQESNIVDGNPKLVESSAFSVQENESQACQGSTRLVQGTNCGIENADLSCVIPEVDERGQLVSSVPVNSSEEKDAQRYEIPKDDEKTEENTVPRGNEIVDVNPKLVESVQSLSEDNSSPACQASTESLVQEAPNSGMDGFDLPSTIAETTAFEQSASSVGENLNVERYEIPDDKENTEENMVLQEDEIVDVNPKLVESVQSLTEDNNSPACEASTESLAQEAPNSGMDGFDFPGTIAETTAFEQSASSVEENLNVERHETDDDERTEMNTLVDEGAFSVQENESLACQGVIQLPVQEMDCGIENADLSGVIPEVDECGQSVSSIMETSGEEQDMQRYEIPEDDEKTEENTVSREDEIVYVNPKLVESVQSSAEDNSSLARHVSTESLVKEAKSGIYDPDLPSTIAETTAFDQSASPHKDETVDVDAKSVESFEVPAEFSVSPDCQILTHPLMVQKANGELDDADSSDAITKIAAFEKSDSPAVENSNEDENAERLEIHDENEKTEKNTMVLEDGIVDVNPKSAGSGEVSAEENGSLACRRLIHQLPGQETNSGIENDDPFDTIPAIDEFEQCDVDVLENTCAEVERKVDSIIRSLENDSDRDDEARLPLTKSISLSIQESRCPTFPGLESIGEIESPNLQDDEILDEVQLSAKSEINLMGIGGDVESIAGPSTPVVVDALTPAVDESDVNCEVDDLTNLSNAAGPISDEYEYIGDSSDCDEVMNSCCSVSKSVKKKPAPKDADVDRSVTISLTVKSQKGKKRQRDDDSSDDECMIEKSRETCNEKPKVKRQQLEDNRSDEDVEIFVERPEKRKRSPSINSSSDDESCAPTRADKKQRTSPSTSNFISDEAAVSAAGRGRKNIRQIMSDEELGEETQEMGKKEEARRKFVKERKILLEQLEEPGTPRKRLVLDYCFEKKEVILEVHPKIVEKLKPHQAEGIRFMFDACYESAERAAAGTGGGCILAHNMGLGKTLQAIALIHTVLSSDKIRARTVLVLCPLSVIPNWIAEFREWLADIENKNDIRIFDIQKHKTDQARAEFLKQWQTRGGVLILNYEMFKQLVDPPANRRPALKHSQQMKAALSNPGPDLVVCDEGHILKNDKTVVSKAAMSIKTSRRIVLTGTPLQNDLKEYHSIINFVKPNFLGTKDQFTNRFVNPITNGQYKDSKPEDVALMKSRNYILNRKTGGIVQRFDFSILTPYLEPKYEYVISVGLSDLQARLYQYYLDNETSATASDRSAGHFAHHSALRLLCNHPLTLKLHAEKPKQKKKKKANENDEEDVEENINSQWWRHLVSNSDVESASSGPKLILLLAILRHCQKVDEKLLVFTSSIPTLDMIEHFLQQKQFGGWKKDKDYYRVDGDVPSVKRTKYFGDFSGSSNTKVRLLLVTTGVGGLGINLTAANRVIIFDANWNPSKDCQSVYRVFRLGQKKPSYIYRFVAQGTMEEKKYKRQITKLSVACRVVDKQQIERHYLLKNISELYEFDRKMPTGEVFKLPNDHVLAELLKAHRDIILSYHEHDSLLENKPEEDLPDETKLAAWEHYEVESALMLRAPAPSGEKKPAGKDDEGCSAAAQMDAPLEADVGSSPSVDQDKCLDLSTRIETASEGNRNDVLPDLSVPTKSLAATNVGSEVDLMAVEDHCYALEEPTETSSDTDVRSRALSVAPTDLDEDVHENSSEQTAVGSVAPPSVMELLEDRDDDTFSEPPGETQTWLSETDDVEPATSSMLESEDRNDASGTDTESEAPCGEPNDPVVDVLEVGSIGDHLAESDLSPELEGQESVPDTGAASTDEGPQEEEDDAILQENVESDDSENDVIKVVDDASATNAVESNVEVRNDVMSFSLLTFGEVNEPAQNLLMSEEFIMPNGFGAVEESPFLDMRQKCRWW